DRRSGRAPRVLETGRAGQRPITCGIDPWRHIAMATASEQLAPPAEVLPGRRTFFKWLTYGLGAVATLAAGGPFLGYLLGARKAPINWVPLGPVAGFPPNQTRLVTFANPIRQPWDGMVADTGVYVRYVGEDPKATDEATKHKFLVFAVNCAHLGCPVS